MDNLTRPITLPLTFPLTNPVTGAWRRSSTPGVSLTAPVLTLLTDATDNTPLWSFDLTNPLEDDVIRIEWDNAIPYATQVNFSDYTLTALDLEGDFDFDFGLSAFADGPWSWRAYHMRGASSSSVSNEVSETIVTAVAPVNTVAPVISGNKVLGQTLTTTDGTWTGTATIVYTYQWKRGGSSIGSATASTYVLVAADEGQSITCVVTGTNGVGNSTGTSNAFTIFKMLDLFASAEKGAWLDPSYLANMFQATAGTGAVAADGDPVGYMLDRTANGHIFLRISSDANRPLYKTSAGKNWLLFDGVNDYLRKANANIANNIGFITMWAAIDATSEATGRTMLCALTNPGLTKACIDLTTSDFARVSGRRLDADSNQNATGSVDRATGTPVIIIGEIDYANTDAFIYAGQTLDASNTSFQTAGTTTATDGNVDFGSNNGGSFFDGKIYDAGCIARQLTSQEKTNLGLRLAAVSGATW